MKPIGRLLAAMALFCLLNRSAFSSVICPAKCRFVRRRLPNGQCWPRLNAAERCRTLLISRKLLRRFYFLNISKYRITKGDKYKIELTRFDYWNPELKLNLTTKVKFSLKFKPLGVAPSSNTRGLSLPGVPARSSSAEASKTRTCRRLPKWSTSLRSSLKVRKQQHLSLIFVPY